MTVETAIEGVTRRKSQQVEQRMEKFHDSAVQGSTLGGCPHRQPARRAGVNNPLASEQM